MKKTCLNIRKYLENEVKKRQIEKKISENSDGTKVAGINSFSVFEEKDCQKKKLGKRRKWGEGEQEEEISRVGGGGGG